MANFNDARAEGIGLIHFHKTGSGSRCTCSHGSFDPGLFNNRLLAAYFGCYIALSFVLAAVIIYITQFFVAGYSVTLLGAVIGALVYGIIDAIIPGRGM